MVNLKYIILLFQILFFVFTINAQYKLKLAFPNLPTFSAPLEIVHADDGTNRLFVVQRRGLIYVFNNSPTVSTRKIFINLSNRISQHMSLGMGGLAFHPNYENNRFFYVHYIFDSTGGPSGRWIKVSRFTTSLSNPDTALVNTELNLFTIPINHFIHTGGKLAFGLDGYLYIANGDGDTQGDPLNHAQNKSVLLGKILRINVDSASGGRNYSIPLTNPFYGNTQGYKQEIYAYGLRNPWKFSFDYTTNNLWLGDVGYSSFEEIDLIENGKNYGWNKMEGFHCQPINICDTTGMNFTRPVIEYSRDSGTSITGGYVYRGNLLPDLVGKYIFADFVAGKIWALTYNGINLSTYERLLDTNFLISSFGLDEDNEIYVCEYAYGAGEKIYKLYNSSVVTLNLKAIIEGFYNSSSDTMVSDTIIVYLRNAVLPFEKVDSAKAVLNISEVGTFIFFNATNDINYYVVVKHRNSIETWSSSAIAFSSGALTYDFTSAANKAYGNNQAQVDNSPVKFGIYSGDANQDGAVDLTDESLIDNDSYNYVSGYVATDLNGDNAVDLSDEALADNNSYNSVSIARP